jgi:hypothetical protein
VKESKQWSEVVMVLWSGSWRYLEVVQGWLMGVGGERRAGGGGGVTGCAQ